MWDLNRFGPNDFLGEVLLDLDSITMGHDYNWYPLKPHEESANLYVSIVSKQTMSVGFPSYALLTKRSPRSFGVVQYFLRVILAPQCGFVGVYEPFKVFPTLHGQVINMGRERHGFLTILSLQRYHDDDADGEHLSPPSTSTSRLSDSDTPSECDLRRHHSLSSLASSSSPPPPHSHEVSAGTQRPEQARHSCPR